MGNHHSSGSKTGDSTPSSRRQSKSDHHHHQQQQQQNEDKQQQQQQQTQLLPVDKLTQILCEKARTEEGIDGISLTIFTKYLFPRYTILAEKLFSYFHSQSNSSQNFINSFDFKQQCEKYLAILDDDTVRDVFVKMFATTNNETIKPDELYSLLMCSYHISMDHYSEGPQMCLSINKTLKSVIDGCFNIKQQLSQQYVSHWLNSNCPRLLLPLHRYIVHCLATSYRTLDDKHQETPQLVGLELATPVLEEPPPFCSGGMHQPKHLLQMSMSWLLAGSLPQTYSRPQQQNTSGDTTTTTSTTISPTSSGINLSTYLTKFLCPLPSHWLLLYDSNEMGLGLNRFLHHVLSYKGPTLLLLRNDNQQIFCIATTVEWHESHLYWGDENTTIIQLLPKYQILEAKVSKSLYLNTQIRGYPFGLCAGKDPRKPIIKIDQDFNKIEYCQIPYNLERIEVWGCGDPIKREQQLEIKKWEIKEAERQRCVKLSPNDWLDHPDRYLLELAGRQQYHPQQQQQQ